MRAIPRFLAPSILKSSQRGKFAPEPIINYKLKESIIWDNKDLRDIAMFLVGRLIHKQSIDKYIQN
ncbi:hypothetical protein BKP38_14430 [Lacticaseibacillus rhamnosus]|nr:hypothetical protein BKP38_14430 [Lacticaseibacillus rhamnosus]